MFKKFVAALCFATVIASAGQASANSWGFRFRPLPVLIGMIDADVDIGLGSNFAVTPGFVTWNFTLSDLSASISGFRVMGSYYFNGPFTDGWYLGGGYQSLNMTLSDADSEGEVSVGGFTAIGGYLWQWSSFYMNLGGEFVTLSKAKVEVKNKISQVVEEEKDIPVAGFGIDWKLGWSF